MKILTATDIEANRIADATAHMAAQRAAREAAGLPARKPAVTAWVDDLRDCIKRLGKRLFTIRDLANYHAELERKHPENHDIESSIRHALQQLREAREVVFVDNKGTYIYKPFER